MQTQPFEPELHAVIKPSAAPEWAYCSASIPLQLQYPETGHNAEAEEGRAAHWVAATVLADFIECGRKGHHYKRENFLDKPAPNGVLVTEEMLDAVEVYVRTVMDVSSRYSGSNWVLLEHRVRMPGIHPENWGTLDNAVIFYDVNADTVVIMDFKYGYVIVEAFEAWQLIDYSAGLINDLWERGLPMPRNVEFCIVQPRPHHKDGPVRTWVVPLPELTPYYQHLSRQAHEALSGNARAVPGTHCTYCTARHACVALRTSNYAAITYVMGEVARELTPAELGAHISLLRHASKLIESQLAGYETQALRLIEHGTGVPGWEWERADGRLNWTASFEKILTLASMYKKDLRKPVLITPLQAIKLGLPESVVNRYASRTAGEPKLKPANLKRTAQIFGGNK